METINQIVIVMFYLTTAVSPSVIRQPIGSQLCRELYRRVYECSYYNFTSHSLLCQLQNCSSRMIHFKFSRLKIQITAELGGKLKGEAKSPPADYTNKGPRILLVSNTRERDSYQINLSNMFLLSPYNHLKRQDVSALVYLHASKKLLLSNKRKNKIYAYSLDSEKYSVLVSNHSTDNFGLDESRGLVFFYSKQAMSNTGYIVRMMYDGSNVTLIKSLRGRVSRRYVMVDIKNQRLYMNIEYHFTNVYTYSGAEVGHLFADIPSLKDIHVIAFDQRNLWLYHVADETLSKVSLQDKRQTEIRGFDHNPRQVVLNNGNLYVAVPRISKLYVIDKTSQVKEIRLKFKSYDDWNICVV